VIAALATASGVLYFLGYLGWGIWPCLLVFLVPLWRALDGARALHRGASTGGGFGAVAYVGGFTWLWHLVDPFLDGNHLVGAVLWLAYGAWFAAGFALYGLTVRAIRTHGWSMALAGVPPLLVLEWLQLQIFPLYAGNALVTFPVWAQAADIGGPLLLTGLLGYANVVVFEAWAWWRGERARPTALALVAVLVAAITFGYGRLRMGMVDGRMGDAPALRVGVVQANLDVLRRDALSVQSHERHLAQTRELLAGGDLDLVVWPESAYVRGLRRPLPISGRPIRKELSVPLLFGAASVVEQGGRRRKSNSAFLVDADGEIRDGYDKNLLIPLAEYLPLAGVLGPLSRWLPRSEEFGAADTIPVLHLGTWRIATPICYEAIRPEFVRRMVQHARPHLLITLANDAWFGDSQEPWLHLALARLRAIEHRRWMVRATNSGISAIIDPAGRIVAETGVLTRANLRGVVHLLDGETVYGRLGDWPGWVAIVVVGLTLIGPAVRRLRVARIRTPPRGLPPHRTTATAPPGGSPALDVARLRLGRLA